MNRFGEPTADYRSMYELVKDNETFKQLQVSFVARLRSFPWVQQMLKGEDFPESIEGIKEWARKYYGTYENFHRDRYQPGGIHGPRYPFTWYALVGTPLEPFLNDYRLHIPFQGNKHSFWHTDFMRRFNSLINGGAEPEPIPEPEPPTPDPVPEPTPDPEPDKELPHDWKEAIEARLDYIIDRLG